MEMSETAFIGLGANVGEPRAQLEQALQALSRLPDSRLEAQSRLYHSPPWGIESQPPFVNAVARLRTRLSPDALLQHLLAIERAAGRERRQRWGPRVLDLDLLLFGAVQRDQPGLRLPHPHLHQRAFVLVPLAELAPDFVVPGHGRVDALLGAVDSSGIKALG